RASGSTARSRPRVTHCATSVTPTWIRTSRGPKIERPACNALARGATNHHPRIVRSPHMVNDATLLAPLSPHPTVSSPMLAATQAAPSSTGRAFEAPVSAARTTVLPRVEGDGTQVALSLESRSRYEPTKLLGAGGMGEVVLVRDHDIERKVAL